MLIEKQSDSRNQLQGKVILLTGAGGGIGFEAAKAFAFMGATIIIAEIDKVKGNSAVDFITNNFPNAKVEFYEIDLSEEQQIYSLHKYLTSKYSFVDVLFHNATLTAMGNVEDVPINLWEKSYRVNFKAPLLLTQLFLPEMKKNNCGTIVFVPSSGAAPYMGAYEVFKTAQVELCNTLAGELENTNIYTYSIGPGLVKTETAMRGIKIVANKMGMSTDEFYALNEHHILSAEEAGCGFAISVLRADIYHGQEIGSIQALLDSGMLVDNTPKENNIYDANIIPLISKIITVFEEQYFGWMSRNIFERQWVLRDFKKTVGMSADQYYKDILRLREELQTNTSFEIISYKSHFEKLKQYFQHQYKLLQGFEKNPDKLRENSNIIMDWVDTLNKILI